MGELGTRRFQVRLPDSLARLRDIEPYCAGPFISVRAHREDLILELDAEEIYEDYYDGEEDDWMGSLLPLREDLLRGDYRCLYFAWLRSVQDEAVEDDEYEPPVPPCLRTESEPLSASCSFFDVDLDLIEAAAEKSGVAPQEPSVEDVVESVKILTIEKKDALLCAAVSGWRPALGAELLRLYYEANPPRNQKTFANPRTAGEIRAAARALAKKRERELAARKEAERRRREAEKAVAREAISTAWPLEKKRRGIKSET